MKERLQHQHTLKSSYDQFEKFLLSKGILLSRDTEVGHWGVTHLPAVFELLEKLDIQKKHSFVDLGSGDGRVALAAGLYCDNSQGIEFDDWLLGSANTIKGKHPHLNHVEFHKKDFMNHNLEEYDFIYHSPDQPYYRGRLNQKLLNELKGKLIVHGWEFHPKGLTLEEEHIINGEMFRVYKNPNLF